MINSSYNIGSVRADEPWHIDRKVSATGSVEIFDAHHIAITILVNIGLQFSCFLVTVIGRVDSLKDGVGGISFLFIVLLTLILAQTFDTRQIIVTTFVCIWAVRLSAYLFIRAYCLPKVTVPSEDVGTNDALRRSRQMMRIRFAIFWTVQAVWVFVVSLPVVLINSPVYSSLTNHRLSDTDSLGIVMWTVGFLCEFFADLQKHLFKRKYLNEGKFCTDDLWTWSRHPNYFGEMMQWWGIFVMYTQIIQADWMWTGILSPIFVSTILLFIQTPALEQYSDMRFGLNSEYQEYKLSTSPIIPMPPELYVKFPHFIQMLFLFEFPLYNYIPEDARPKKPEDNCPKAVRRLDMPY